MAKRRRAPKCNEKGRGVSSTAESHGKFSGKAARESRPGEFAPLQALIVTTGFPVRAMTMF